METNIMKDNFKMARKMDSVFIITLMAPYIKASGRTTWNRGRESISTVRKISMKVHYLPKILGDYKDGKKNGQGKCIYQNKDVYEGEWNEDLFNGKGKYLYWN